MGTDTSGIRLLYNLFRDSPFVEYIPDFSWPKDFFPQAGGLDSLAMGNESDVPEPECISLETLLVRKNPDSKDFLLLGGGSTFGQLWVAWGGAGYHSLQQTMDEMKLPLGWTENAGEKAFYLFREHLRSAKMEWESRDAPMEFSVALRAGKEFHFRVIIRKLISIYAKDSE